MVHVRGWLLLSLAAVHTLLLLLSLPLCTHGLCVWFCVRGSCMPLPLVGVVAAAAAAASPATVTAGAVGGAAALRLPLLQQLLLLQGEDMK